MLEITEYKNADSVFRFFEEISKIPHGSENTSPIADYLVDFARERGLWYTRDKSDNVIIRKGATPGYEDRPTVIFQGHTDMVADKTADCEKDLEKEGLDLYRDGDFIRAKGTTLGADDGIALAYALAVLDADDIPHPEFEALFTSDEEIGLLGATALDAKDLKGKLMINIDSDDEGVFTVGCAGGIRTDTSITVKKEADPCTVYTLSVSGLKGGHSGVEIDKGRINAIKVVAEILSAITDVRISAINGGNADNAIPRSTECSFTFCECEKNKLLAAVAKCKEKYTNAEPDIEFSLKKLDKAAPVLNIQDSARILKFINEAPSGVVKMSDDIVGQVETSANLGIIETADGAVRVAVSLRSSKNTEKEKLLAKIQSIADSIDAEFDTRGAYPAWEYKKDSYLRELMRRVYADMYGKEPEVVTIHAGLECGIFSEKIPGLDCVSMGPDNFDIHTPEEHLSISSTARVWEYLKNVLKEI